MTPVRLRCSSKSLKFAHLSVSETLFFLVESGVEVGVQHDEHLQGENVHPRPPLYICKRQKFRVSLERPWRHHRLAFQNKSQQLSLQGPISRASNRNIIK